MLLPDPAVPELVVAVIVCLGASSNLVGTAENGGGGSKEFRGGNSGAPRPNAGGVDDSGANGGVDGVVRGEWWCVCGDDDKAGGITDVGTTPVLL